MTSKTKPVLAIGGANGERIISLERHMHVLGRKHVLNQSFPVGAGSSVNHACRLLSSGVQVMPIIPVINDHTGNLVVETLKKASLDGKTPFVFRQEWYMSPIEPNEATQFTTIVNVGEERTVYSETSSKLTRSFSNHYRRLRETITPTDVSAVVIGHIYADADSGDHGEITKNVINRFAEFVPVIVNFGASQYMLGKSTWIDYLSKISYFQLDLAEMRQFFGSETTMLKDVLKWFRELCTVVITLDRKGAIAQIRNSDEVTFVWPYELGQNLVDTTGAGDAFAAAVTRELSAKGNSEPSIGEWQEMLSFAALNAAYSCCHKGGTGNCPSISKLEEFKKREKEQSDYIVDTLEKSVGEKILRFVDKLQN